MKLRPISQLQRNKRGQAESIILAVITIVIIGIILFFFNHMNKRVYDEFDEYFEGSEYNATTAHETLEDIQDVEGSRIWDWVFLAAFIGINIQMIVFAFASRQNLLFFWLFVVLGIVILLLGVILSNVWQDLVANSEFTTTLTRFPVTNAIIGTYFPTIITGVFYLTLIILFGKFPGRQE